MVEEEEGGGRKAGGRVRERKGEGRWGNEGGKVEQCRRGICTSRSCTVRFLKERGGISALPTQAPSDKLGGVEVGGGCSTRIWWKRVWKRGGGVEEADDSGDS